MIGTEVVVSIFSIFLSIDKKEYIRNDRIGQLKKEEKGSGPVIREHGRNKIIIISIIRSFKVSRLISNEQTIQSD